MHVDGADYFILNYCDRVIALSDVKLLSQLSVGKCHFKFTCYAFSSNRGLVLYASGYANVGWLSSLLRRSLLYLLLPCFICHLVSRECGIKIVSESKMIRTVSCMHFIIMAFAYTCDGLSMHVAPSAANAFFNIYMSHLLHSEIPRNNFVCQYHFAKRRV